VRGEIGLRCGDDRGAKSSGRFDGFERDREIRQHAAKLAQLLVGLAAGDQVLMHCRHLGGVERPQDESRG
jgi:hypothetical protein